MDAEVLEAIDVLNQWKAATRNAALDEAAALCRLVGGQIASDPEDGKSEWFVAQSGMAEDLAGDILALKTAPPGA